MTIAKTQCPRVAPCVDCGIDVEATARTGYIPKRCASCRAIRMTTNKARVKAKRRIRPVPKVGFGYAHDVARVIGVSRCAVRGWVKHGLPCELVNGYRIFDVEACRQWAQANNRFRKKRAWFGPATDDAQQSGVIYAICDPMTHEVRYVGKSMNFKNRKARYMAGCVHNPHLKNLFAKWKAAGHKPEFKILESCLFYLATAEMKWIAHGKAKGWRLVNMTEGGDGIRPGPELKQRSRERALRNHADPMIRGKMIRNLHIAVARRCGMTLEQWEQARRDRNDPAMLAASKANKNTAREQRRIAAIAKRDQQRSELRERKRQEFGELVPLTHNGGAFVPLTRGAWAIVDAEDYEAVSKSRWNLQIKGGMCRAKRTVGDHQCELLPRLLMQAVPGQMVIPRDGNHLNCRRSNLVLTHGSGRPTQSHRFSEAA